MTPTQMLREFHEAFGVFYADSPTLDIPVGMDYLRGNLIEEECEEVLIEIARTHPTMRRWRATDDELLSKIAKELADLVYVTYGTAITYGIDLDEVLKAVHASNMSKLGPNGEVVRRDDGKILKPLTYLPPDVQAVLEAQRHAARRHEGKAL